MRRNLIAEISIIALSGFLISTRLEAATIFVDGMSPEMTAAGVAVETKGHYQGPYLQSSDLGVRIKEKEKNWNYVGWSGNPLSANDVNQVIDKLKDEIITFHKTLPNEPINIVSHSYGTVIAYRALEEISNSNDPNIKNIKIDTFITMGSPLGEGSVGQILLVREAADIPANKNLKTPEGLNIKHWENYYADRDGFGGSIGKSDVDDIKIQGDHETYFTNPNNAIEIAFVLNTFSKLSKDGNTIKNISTNSSQQAVINTSTQQAIKFSETLPTGLPYGQISPELAKTLTDKKIVIDFSKLAERTAQSLTDTNYIYLSEKIIGTWFSNALHVGSQASWTETLYFNRDGTYKITNSLGGEYGGTYSIITSGPLANPFPKMLDYDVQYTTGDNGTLSAGDYGRGTDIANNSMTLRTDGTGVDPVMVGGYAKQ